MPKSSAARRRRLLAATLSATMLAAPQAHAVDRVGIGLAHFFDCAGLLLSKPAEHAKNCLPNRVPADFNSLSSMGDGTGAPVIVAPPVVVVPPVVVAPPPPPPAPCDPSPCGGCSYPT